MLSNSPRPSYTPPEGPPVSISRSALRHLRRVIVAVIGVTVLAIGVAMIILPGPAMVVIPLGLGILAIDFAGQGNNILRPFLGDASVLLLDGAEHLRQRRLLLPPFHGERMLAYADLIRDITLAEIERWPRGQAFAVHPSMQEITLEVIMRAVFGMESGARHDALRGRLKQVLDEGSRSILVFLPFLQFDLGGLTPYARFKRRMAEVDRLL